MTHLIHLAHQTCNFLGMQQQFAGPGRIRDHVSGGRRQRSDLCVEQKRLTAPEHHVGFGDLGLAGTQGLHFPAQ